MASIANVKVGVAEVFIDGTSIGHTTEDTTVTYEVDYADITVNQYGPGTMGDKVSTGERMMTTFTMSEWTVANLAKVIPLGDNTTADKLTIGSDSGKRLSDSVVTLRLHPQSKADTNYEDDVYMYKAVCADPVDFAYAAEEQRSVEVTFSALVDETKSDGSYLGVIGDYTA